MVQLLSGQVTWCLFREYLNGNQTIRRQTNLQSLKSWTSQLAEMFDLDFGVYYHPKHDFG